MTDTKNIIKTCALDSLTDFLDDINEVALREYLLKEYAQAYYEIIYCYVKRFLEREVEAFRPIDLSVFNAPKLQISFQEKVIIAKSKRQLDWWLNWLENNSKHSGQNIIINPHVLQPYQSYIFTNAQTFIRKQQLPSALDWVNLLTDQCSPVDTGISYEEKKVIQLHCECHDLSQSVKLTFTYPYFQHLIISFLEQDDMRNKNSYFYHDQTMDYVKNLKR